VYKLHSACVNLTRACVITLVSVYISHSACKITLCRWKLQKKSRACHNHIHTCQNHTLRVEFTLVRVEITVASVVITFVHVKVSLRVEITLCIRKSHSACRNHSCTCLNHFRGCRNYIFACQNHTACDNNTLCVP
jgi:hypothetical protein